MIGSAKSRARRTDIRKGRPDAPLRVDWQALREGGVFASAGIAAAFYVLATAIMMLRQDVVPYRPQQWVPHDIVSRVTFSYADPSKLADEQLKARDAEPRVYQPAVDESGADTWAALERELLAIPERLDSGAGEVPTDLAELDPGTVTLLRQWVAGQDKVAYERDVRDYVAALRDYRIPVNNPTWPLIVLPAQDRGVDLQANRRIAIPSQGAAVEPQRTFAAGDEELRHILQTLVTRFGGAAGGSTTLQQDIVRLTQVHLTQQPTHRLDTLATTEAQNRAAERVPRTAGDRVFPANAPLVLKSKGVFSSDDVRLLRAENEAYLATVKGYDLKSRLGLAGVVLIVTVVLAGYVARYQPKVLKNHARAVAIAALLLSMLLLAQIAGIGNGPLYIFGVAPTILVAMILVIAYDQRFAIGVASLHALLVTLALDQSILFFAVLWVGVLTTCYLLDDIRSRSKLIEVGGAAAVAMIAATAAASALSLDPWPFVLKNCLHVGAAGLGVGFIVLGILPFIEWWFRITTSMTLLELADGSHPLLRRLSVEAPGTYSHSFQVAALSEAAAEAVGANSLLCRVGSYYHDVGKIHKADYFIENQPPGGLSRHLNLSPSVSLLIIIGHVKDGVELAKEYHLPTSLIPFIQQHHGTTLVEYFYHQAKTQKEQRQPDYPAIPEEQYRYPGPKPRSKEVAIVMIADAVESASRSMVEPTASRVESLVHELAMKRLLDGQFDECDLTMRELELIERSLMKTLMGIYHGRIAYPSTRAISDPQSVQQQPAAGAAPPAAKTA